jgi:hypothetical protein
LYLKWYRRQCLEKLAWTIFANWESTIAGNHRLHTHYMVTIFQIINYTMMLLYTICRTNYTASSTDITTKKDWFEESRRTNGKRMLHDHQRLYLAPTGSPKCYFFDIVQFFSVWETKL